MLPALDHLHVRGLRLGDAEADVLLHRSSDEVAATVRDGGARSASPSCINRALLSAREALSLRPVASWSMTTFGPEAPITRS